MKKILLLLLTCLLLQQAFAQNTLPKQLLGNWLSPKHNEWKYSFHEQYAIADGAFWTYEVVRQKKNSLELLLQNGEKQQKLYIAFEKGNQVKIGSSKKDAVRLTQQRNELPDYAYYDKIGFQEPLIQPGVFQLTGVINGYVPGQDDYKYIKVIYNHLVEDKQKNYVAALDSLGRFMLEFPLMNPQEIMLTYGSEMISFFAVPDSDLLICINSEKESKPASTEAYLQAIKTRDNLQFMGREGMLNTEINSYDYNLTKILDFRMDKEQLKKSDQMAYKAFRTGKMEEQLQHLRAYAQQHHSGKRFIQQLEQRIKYHAAEDLLRYSWLKDFKTRVPLTEEYLAFTKEMPVNNELAVITQNYPAFVKEVASIAFAGVAPHSRQAKDFASDSASFFSFFEVE